MAEVDYANEYRRISDYPIRDASGRTDLKTPDRRKSERRRTSGEGLPVRCTWNLARLEPFHNFIEPPR